jgi:hypothetical protein
VIAHGFQTYGDDYKVDKADMTIEIRMKRPGEQYSIYKNHDAAASGTNAPAPSKDAAPVKPADPAPQPSQPQTN